MITTTLDSGCTPSYRIAIDYDDNPNGLPVLWMHIAGGRGTIASVPLNKTAVSKLLVEFANRIGAM